MQVSIRAIIMDQVVLCHKVHGLNWIFDLENWIHVQSVLLLVSRHCM